MIKTLRLSLLLTLLVVTAYYVVLHFRVVGIPHPITQDEPGTVELTSAANPYTADGVVAAASVYGPGYAIWARPFTVLFDNTYVAHRVASSVALFAALAVLGLALRRQRVGGIEIAAGLSIFYILNVSSHSLAAAPDFLGLALFLAMLAVSSRGTWPALLTGLLILCAAGLTKPYFALAWLAVASHQILFAPLRRALAYLLVSLVVAAAAIVVLHWVAPYYFFSTLAVHRVAAVRNASFLIGQTREFILLAGGVLALAVATWPRRRRVRFSWRESLLAPSTDLWTVAAIVATAALLGSLGWHLGNYLVYYYHLLLAPLIILGLRNIEAWPRAGRLLLCANLVVLGFLLPPLPGADHWAELEADVRSVAGPVLADPWFEPLASMRPGLDLISRGQTASVLQIMDNLGDALPAENRPMHAALVAQAERINDRIRERKYAAIYISYQEIGPGGVWTYDQRHVLPTLFAHYRAVGEFVFIPYATPYWDRMAHGKFPAHVTRWEPRPPPDDSAQPKPPDQSPTVAHPGL